jgi:RNA polymerase sigma-70 factor (ECF subfamily)
MMGSQRPQQASTLRSQEAVAAWNEPRTDLLAEAARRDFQFLWRTLRRLGVTPEAAVDDAVQQVFEVAARKRALIEPGRERAFLFKTALLVAADVRRAQRRNRAQSAQTVHEAIDSSADPEQRVDAALQRELLDRVLDAMSLEIRTVFVLFELEEFQAEARRLRARERFRGGL